MSLNPVAEKLGELGLPEPIADLAGRDWDVAVVGGGHNGLTTAAYLAKAGKSVIVLERRERVGGACTLERPFSDDRYVVSPCAYVIGMLDELVIDELELRRRGIEIRIADPAQWIPFDDGTAFAEWDDHDRTVAGLRELGVSDADINGFDAYSARFDRCRRLLRMGERDAWVGDSPSRAELEEMLNGEQELLDILFEASIAEILDEHVSDQRIKDALYGQGLIAAWGGPKTPGTAAIHLMHHMGDLEGNGSSWGYVKGGMGMVSFAIADAAIEAGATIACDVPVGAIKPGEGVELEDGTLIRAREVVCNADPKVALRLLGDAGIPSEFEQRLDDWKVRSPVIKVNAALSELPKWTAAGGESWPVQGTVNARKSLDEAQEAFEAAERGEVSIGFTEIYSQTSADDTVAPPDRHVISVFSQYAPADKSPAEWDAGLRDEAGNQVFDLIERYAPGFRELVVEYEVMGPPDIEERIGLTGGNIFQGECFPDQMWENRFSARTPVDGLFLCGAATHPGGSVIGLNGRNAAMALLSERAPA